MPICIWYDSNNIGKYSVSTTISKMICIFLRKLIVQIVQSKWNWEYVHKPFCLYLILNFKGQGQCSQGHSLLTLYTLRYTLYSPIFAQSFQGWKCAQGAPKKFVSQNDWYSPCEIDLWSSLFTTLPFQRLTIHNTVHINIFGWKFF